VLVVGAFVAFTVLHGAARHVAGAAASNAHALQRFEATLGLDVERGANAWLAASATPVQVAAVVVYRSYYLVIVGVLAWLYVRHPEAYVRARRALLAMLLLVLAVYWTIPMSPPRYAMTGIVDVVAGYSPIGTQSAAAAGNAQTLSAMPSLHVALAAWCAYAVGTALRPSHPRGAVVAWAFPLLMTGVVLTTGNHYVLDVVGSALVLAAAVGLAAAWGRARPASRIGGASESR